MLEKIFGKQNKDVFVIAGLGNPEHKYDGTRHNVGFDAIDKIADAYGIKLMTKKFNGYMGKGIINGHRVILVKPMTYMNNSGECVGRLVNYEKVDYENHLIIICDDIHLPVGKIRIKKKGSAGGHNGLKNVEFHLGSSEYPRLRIGVGEVPAGGDQVKHVLGHLDGTDRKTLDDSLDAIVSEIPNMLDSGIDHAMNNLNGR